VAQRLVRGDWLGDAIIYERGDAVSHKFKFGCTDGASMNHETHPGFHAALPNCRVIIALAVMVPGPVIGILG